MDNTEIRIYPEWFGEEERRGLDEIREFLRSGNYPVGALVIEKDSCFVQAEVGKVTDLLRQAAYNFNDGSHPILFDFVSEDRISKGGSFHV